MISKLAASLLILSQASAGPQCLPPAEAGRHAAAILPSMIDAAARQCSSHLPEGAFLRSGAGALAQRLRAETTAQDRAAAVAAALAITGQAPARGQDPDRMIDVLTAGFALALEPAQCRSASDLLEALAPLPAANFGKAFGAILGTMAARSEEPSPICAG